MPAKESYANVGIGMQCEHLEAWGFVGGRGADCNCFLRVFFFLSFGWGGGEDRFIWSLSISSSSRAAGEGRGGGAGVVALQVLYKPLPCVPRALF